MPISDETRKKMSLAKMGKPGYWLGRKRDKETIRKLRESRIGKPGPRLGSKMSKETKLKMSQDRKGKSIGVDNPFYGRKHTEEAKKRMSDAKGGRHNNPYPVDWTDTLRRAIRERDHYTCQVCGKPQGDIALSVHHIDYVKNNCNTDNLITLCMSCHSKTKYNKEYWVKYFQ